MMKTTLIVARVVMSAVTSLCAETKEVEIPAKKNLLRRFADVPIIQRVGIHPARLA